ncbi:ABC transporter permease [Nitratireductor aquimarinus]|uniref:ABC transporter permease n=1 Tax=Nitratireductor aquimarinus TaxID=889300 RepID=UPI001A907D9C|nr:ABC transporter permease [Nitratireductor aquimarinus]MBN8245724.1 ABC transporter permease [Nitratireductor aquimarinus]MBY6134105.1 ABC transporter permease [Nitratireductor aquimarinus]MCA1305204.1 ABC transporter permease [Nitratireductor aquimarinus]
MLFFILQRLITLIATLFFTALVAFFLLEVIPGDPALDMLGTEAREDTLAALRTQLGLDAPLWLRFFEWIAGFATGDLGMSYRYRVPVSELIWEPILITLPLGLIAIVITIVIALPMGALAARYRGKAPDVIVTFFTQLGLAIPNFWFAVLLILIFSVTLGWFAAGGFPGWDAGPGAVIKALLLPALSLALPQAAIIARVTRSSVLEILDQDFVRTARAKGLTRSSTLWKHVLRNAMIPVVTVMGTQFTFMLAGSIIVENVFYLPGLGRLIFQAITQRDLVVIKNVVVLIAALIMIMNFLVDISYAILNPRLRQR